MGSYSVATWRWLKELPSTLAMVRMSTPRRRAAARSMLMTTCWVAASPTASTSRSSGMSCIAREILRDHCRSAGTSLAMMASSWSPELPKPPGMRRSWSTFRKNMPPGTGGALARSQSITWAEDSRRSEAGFRRIRNSELLMPRLPPL
ncbi:Uncharacterised protein [Achromobacter xylosoxidans]|nr:Uncharacterised protein [Achromobacter xylosoxidans]